MSQNIYLSLWSILWLTWKNLTEYLFGEFPTSVLCLGNGFKMRHNDSVFHHFFLHFLIELFDFETDKGFVHGDVKYQTEPSLSTYSRVGVYSN